MPNFNCLNGVPSAEELALWQERRAAFVGFVTKAVKVASAAASGYHGVKRNHGSVVWGLWWFGAGYLVPVLTPTIAAAQGYAKPAPCGI